MHCEWATSHLVCKKILFQQINSKFFFGILMQDFVFVWKVKLMKLKKERIPAFLSTCISGCSEDDRGSLQDVD